MNETAWSQEKKREEKRGKEKRRSWRERNRETEKHRENRDRDRLRVNPIPLEKKRSKDWTFSSFLWSSWFLWFPSFESNVSLLELSLRLSFEAKTTTESDGPDSFLVLWLLFPLSQTDFSYGSCLRLDSIHSRGFASWSERIVQNKSHKNVEHQQSLVHPVFSLYKKERHKIMCKTVSSEKLSLESSCYAFVSRRKWCLLFIVSQRFKIRQQFGKRAKDIQIPSSRYMNAKELR